MEARKPKMVGMKFEIPAEMWPAVGPILKDMAAESFAEEGRLLPNTWNREIVQVDEGLLEVVYTGDVMPHER